jgi:hypothetical protein
MKFKHHTQ